MDLLKIIFELKQERDLIEDVMHSSSAWLRAERGAVVRPSGSKEQKAKSSAKTRPTKKPASKGTLKSRARRIKTSMITIRSPLAVFVLLSSFR